MSIYWIEFDNGPSGCVEAEDAEAAFECARQVTDRNPVKADILPYPAEPRLTWLIHRFKNGIRAKCPSFCRTPEQCKGKTSCPKSYACSE